MKKILFLAIILSTALLNAAVYVDVNDYDSDETGTIDEPFRTIQQGLNVAMGDVSVTEVIVASGTYYENLIIYPSLQQDMSNIYLHSAGSDPANYFIVGNDIGNVIKMGYFGAGGLGVTVTIEGFSITGSGSNYIDSAICTEISANIFKNVIYGCSRAIYQSYDGCGFYGNLDISQNHIYNNNLSTATKVRAMRVVNLNIFDNDIHNNNGTAISVTDCELVEIHKNNIHDNSNGILVREATTLTNPRDFEIHNNIISDNYGFGIKNDEYNGNNQNVRLNLDINDNIISNHTDAIILDFPDEVDIIDNIIINNDTAIKIIRDTSSQGTFDVKLHYNTIANNDYGIYSEYALATFFYASGNIFWDNSVSDIHYTTAPPTSTIGVSYNCIEDLNSLPPYITIVTGNIDDNPIFVNPANDDYKISDSSPCIDAGSLSSNLDSDGTRRDMGYDPVDQNSLTSTRSLRTGWNWLCFPRLKRVDYVNNNINLPTFGTGKFIGSLWDDTVTGAYPIQINGNYINNPIWNNFNWNPSDYVIESIEGFKLEMSGTGSESQVGALESLDTEIVLTNLDTKSSYIGYIAAEPGLITEVVPLDMLQYEFQIQAQHWCATYDPFNLSGNLWTFDTTSEPVIKCGQMIAIKIKDTLNGTFTFQWSEPQTTRVEYTERPMPEYFSFIEQKDYLPVFLELDSNNLPQEIGLYIDGVCKGAAVVNQNQAEEAICQINTYLLEEPEDNWQEELEIVYYDGARTTVRTFSEFAVYNQQNSKFYNQNLILADMLGQDQITITMRDSNYEDAPETEFDFRSYNYPNPFNPTTDIYFSLPASADTSLEIYNVKGQKVRTLVNGKLEQGVHQITWDGTDSNRNSVSSGIYFYRLRSGEIVINKKMMLMK